MPSNRAWVMVLVSLLHGSAPALSQPALTAATILDANRAASGGATVPATIETEYAYSGSGLTDTMHSMTDRMTGAYVDRYVIGPSRGASGFDGQRAWMQDISGAYTPQDGGDRRQVAVNEAYRNANRWWRADRGGARIERVGRETVDNSEAEHLRVAPRGGKVFDAWFDAATHHLVRVDEMQQFLHAISSLRDYAHEQGMAVAHTITVDSGTGPVGVETMRLTRLAIGPARPITAYAMPAWKPTDAAIKGGATETTVPIRLANNHIFVDAFVNGNGPFPFFVDTGGHTILTPSRLAALQLKAEGAAPSAGAGEQTTTNGYARVREIAIGEMRLRDQTAFTLEVGSKETEGFVVGGMIGFEVFRRFVVRVDFGALTMTLIGARLAPSGSSLAGLQGKRCVAARAQRNEIVTFVAHPLERRVENAGFARRSSAPPLSGRRQHETGRAPGRHHGVVLRRIVGRLRRARGPDIRGESR